MQVKKYGKMVYVVFDHIHLKDIAPRARPSFFQVTHKFLKFKFLSPIKIPTKITKTSRPLSFFLIRVFTILICQEVFKFER